MARARVGTHALQAQVAARQVDVGLLLDHVPVEDVDPLDEGPAYREHRPVRHVGRDDASLLVPQLRIGHALRGHRERLGAPQVQVQLGDVQPDPVLARRQRDAGDLLRDAVEGGVQDLAVELERYLRGVAEGEDDVVHVGRAQGLVDRIEDVVDGDDFLLEGHQVGRLEDHPRFPADGERPLDAQGEDRERERVLARQLPGHAHEVLAGPQLDPVQQLFGTAIDAQGHELVRQLDHDRRPLAEPEPDPVLDLAGGGRAGLGAHGHRHHRRQQLEMGASLDRERLGHDVRPVLRHALDRHVARVVAGGKRERLRDPERFALDAVRGEHVLAVAPQIELHVRREEELRVVGGQDPGLDQRLLGGLAAGDPDRHGLHGGDGRAHPPEAELAPSDPRPVEELLRDRLQVDLVDESLVDVARVLRVVGDLEGKELEVVGDLVELGGRAHRHRAREDAVARRARAPRGLGARGEGAEIERRVVDGLAGPRVVPPGEVVDRPVGLFDALEVVPLVHRVGGEADVGRPAWGVGLDEVSIRARQHGTALDLGKDVRPQACLAAERVADPAPGAVGDGAEIGRLRGADLEPVVAVRAVASDGVDEGAPRRRADDLLLGLSRALAPAHDYGPRGAFEVVAEPEQLAGRGRRRARHDPARRRFPEDGRPLVGEAHVDVRDGVRVLVQDIDREQADDPQVGDVPLRGPARTRGGPRPPEGLQAIGRRGCHTRRTARRAGPLPCRPSPG